MGDNVEIHLRELGWKRCG